MLPRIASAASTGRRGSAPPLPTKRHSMILLSSNNSSNSAAATSSKKHQVAVLRQWLQRRGYDRLWGDYFVERGVASVQDVAQLPLDAALVAEHRGVQALVLAARDSCALLEMPWDVLKRKYRTMCRTQTHEGRAQRCAVPDTAPEAWTSPSAEAATTAAARQQARQARLAQIAHKTEKRRRQLSTTQ